MTDTRLKDCLDHWPGDLPAHVHDEAVHIQTFSLNSIARTCRLQYKPDIGRDYWRTPWDTWNNKGGDCEDIAILTGAMVRTVFPSMEMELVLCWEAGTRRGHAVLCVRGIDGLLYLDQKVRGLYDDREFHTHYDEHSRLEWPA